jgi:hypothetical protein
MWGDAVYLLLQLDLQLSQYPNQTVWRSPQIRVNPYIHFSMQLP